MTPFPVIRNMSDLSGPCCPPKPGIKETHRIRHTLPPLRLQNNDQDVLQDEAGAPFLDEVTNSFMYDDFPHTLEG